MYAPLAAGSMVQISVIINTLNEQRWITNVVKSSMRWADEVLVVDMHSDDETPRLAAEQGARVLAFERVGFVEPARKFAVGNANGPWILILDADELIPLSLARRLREIAEGDLADVVDIPFVTYIAGAQMKGAGWGPGQDRHIRFFRKGKIEFHDEIHSLPAVAPGARLLQLAGDDMSVVHFNYFDFDHFVQKLNNYTAIEARELHRASTPPRGPMRTLAAAAYQFLTRYVRLRGYRDGWRGVYLSGLMAFYRFSTLAKHHLLTAEGDRDAIARRYETIAEQIVTEFEGQPPRK